MQNGRIALLAFDTEIELTAKSGFVGLSGYNAE